MTPQERQLIDELFQRLAALENNPRDPEAERAIRDGLRRAPNAAYALVQTVLVQDEALKQADARIQELEDGVRGGGSFLDQMRDALLGRKEEQRGGGSVPSVRPGGAWGDRYQGGSYGREAPGGYPGQGGYQQGGYQQGAQPGYPQPGYGQQQGYPPAGGAGGSFLGTAAAAAAGMIGGSLLLNSFRGMFPGAHQGHTAFDQGGGFGQQPWSGSAADSDLARQAGLDDIGRGGGPLADEGSSRSAGMFDDPGQDMDAGPFDVGGSFDADDTA